METLLNTHLNHRLSTSTCRHLIRHTRAPTRIHFVMRKLISPTNQFRQQRLRSFVVNSPMETDKSQQTESTMMTAEEEKKLAPPPPEKPEPGDCCGSGCVRCVWDVYYEELEEYNKLYNSNTCTDKSKS